MAAENIHDLFDQFAAARNHSVSQVRSVEVADQHLRVVQLELLDNVTTHSLGGSRRVRVNGGRRKHIPQAHELAIFRSKVVSPMTDAMRLVDGKSSDSDLLQQQGQIG